MIAMRPVLSRSQSEDSPRKRCHKSGRRRSYVADIDDICRGLYVTDIDDIAARVAQQMPKEGASQRFRSQHSQSVGTSMKTNKPVKGIAGVAGSRKPKHKKAAQGSTLLTGYVTHADGKGRQAAKSKHDAKLPMQQVTQCAAKAEMVMLNVYDVSRSCLVGAFNQAALPLIDSGLFHVAIEVWQHEFAFGYKENDTGVFCIEPHTDAMHRYRCSVKLGTTDFSEKQCLELVERLAEDWHGSCYHGINRNCTHFARVLAAELGVAEFPDWVDSFGRAAEGWVAPVDLGLCCKSSSQQSRVAAFRSTCSSDCRSSCSSSDDNDTEPLPEGLL
mmetsp:Transcript_30710/g.60314  ORF Transcript_30710/g.60314 Transcript_30710/m.60314 type:complete len:330 (-) Transcript_30710:88-1077(-)